MKKRILCLVCSIVLCLGGLTEVAGAHTVTRGSAEFTALENFLGQLGWWQGSSSYDSQKAAANSPVESGAKNILVAMLSAGSGNCYNDALYPGEARKELWYEKDPLGKFESHWKTNAQKVDWILKNIFNCSESDIATLKSSGLSGNQNIYYLDGYYYNMIGGVGGRYTASITDIQPSGRKYLVAYNLKSMYETTSRPHYAVVEQKNINGKNYWSLYYNAKLQAGQNPIKTGGFFDVQPDSYYCDPILWAVERGITTGTTLTTFSPDATCTKGQILTFLWREEGQPEPSIANPFRDLIPSDYYYKAAIWAAEYGLVSGTAFNAAEPCTRAMTATYLWKLAGSPAVAGSSFADVSASADYAQAVAWAVGQGITSGTGNNQFSPNAICTRGQIVTFLYRYIVEPLSPSFAPNKDWNSAYRDFVINEKFLYAVFDYSDSNDPSHPWGNEVSKMVTLYDMDADGVPELFIHSGYADRFSEMYYVYTFSDGQIAYIGRIKELYYKPGSQFEGIWSYWTESGTDPDYFNYGRKEGNRLYVEGVYSQEFNSTYKKPETNNTALYNEFISTDFSSLQRLHTVVLERIKVMGWDAFVAETFDLAGSVSIQPASAKRGEAVDLTPYAQNKPSGVLPFRDVSKNDWFYASVSYVYQKGLFSGTSATTFSPNSPMDRAMLVTVLYRLEGQPSVSGWDGYGFHDIVSNAYYQNAVNWASARGIVTGTGGSSNPVAWNGSSTRRTFSPHDPIAHEQLEVILYRYAVLYCGMDSSITADLGSYKDGSQVSDYAKRRFHGVSRKALLPEIC